MIKVFTWIRQHLLITYNLLVLLAVISLGSYYLFTSQTPQIAQMMISNPNQNTDPQPIDYENVQSMPFQRLPEANSPYQSPSPTVTPSPSFSPSTSDPTPPTSPARTPSPIPSSSPPTGNPSICTQEAKQCPDGSWVGRTGPDCQFECPVNSNNNAGYQSNPNDSSEPIEPIDYDNAIPMPITRQPEPKLTFFQKILAFFKNIF